MEDILKNRTAANTDKVTGNSVNIIRKYLNEKNLPVDFESFDDKVLDELLSKFYREVRRLTLRVLMFLRLLASKPCFIIVLRIPDEC